MAQTRLPAGYAYASAWPRRAPQPPVLAPPPYPPGTSLRVSPPPMTKSGGPIQAPLIVQPIIKIYHSIFG